MTREEEIEQQALLDENAYVEHNYYAFKRGVEWADENPKKGLVSIDKVCDWLSENTNFSLEDIEEFRKAMEE